MTAIDHTRFKYSWEQAVELLRDDPSHQALVFDSLSQLGTMTMYRGVAEEGQLAIFDLTLPPKPWTVTATLFNGLPRKPVVRPSGCVRLRQAKRW